MLASWRGARLEVTQVLREVIDNVLKEKSAPDDVLFNRAKGLLIIGAIFKATQPDESDEDRRELERYVLFSYLKAGSHTFFSEWSRKLHNPSPNERQSEKKCWSRRYPLRNLCSAPLVSALL